MKKSHQGSCVTDSQNRLAWMFIYYLPCTIYNSFYKLGLTFPSKLSIMVTEMALNLSFRMKILWLTLKDTKMHFFKPLDTMIISTPSSQFNGIRSSFSCRTIILIKSHIMFFKISTHLTSLVSTYFSQRGITPTLNPIKCVKKCLSMSH